MKIYFIFPAASKQNRNTITIASYHIFIITVVVFFVADATTGIVGGIFEASHVGKTHGVFDVDGVGLERVIHLIEALCFSIIPVGLFVVACLCEDLCVRYQEVV